MGYLEPKWLSIAANKVDALDIKGYHRRAYYYDKFFCPYMGWNGKPNSHDRFILVVYQNKDDVMCEIRYIRASLKGTPTSSTIDPDIIVKFYDRVNQSLPMFENPRIEEIEGRAFIHGVGGDIPSYSYYGIDRLGKLFAGRLVEYYGNQLSVAIRWNGNLPTFSDIDTVYHELNTLYYNAKGIKYQWNTGRKNGLMTDIAARRKQIDKLNSQLERICELSANAMNTLSEKYGIEISI